MALTANVAPGGSEGAANERIGVPSGSTAVAVKVRERTLRPLAVEGASTTGARSTLVMQIVVVALPVAPFESVAVNVIE